MSTATIPEAKQEGYFPHWKLKTTGMIMPEERLPWGQTFVSGLQHGVAMAGGTIIAPLIMGFDPNLALLFSGVGTLIFFVVVAGRVPSYLGSSFSFVAVVIAATGYSGHGPNPNLARWHHCGRRAVRRHSSDRDEVGRWLDRALDAPGRNRCGGRGDRSQSRASGRQIREWQPIRHHGWTGNSSDRRVDRGRGARNLAQTADHLRSHRRIPAVSFVRKWVRIGEAH